MSANLFLFKLDAYPSYEKEKGVRMPIDILNFPRESLKAEDSYKERYSFKEPLSPRVSPAKLLFFRTSIVHSKTVPA